MQPIPDFEKHFFIEILPDNSVVYGIIRDLTSTQHRKLYFKSADDFYHYLNIPHPQNGLSKLKTLVFFHGWLSDFPFRFSAYLNSFYKNYVASEKIHRTISVIWHTNGRGYGASREYVPTIAQAFRQDFEIFNKFLLSSKSYNYLLCHSMGNFVFQNLVSIMQPYPLAFNHYILAAPDLDCNVFEKGETFENLHQQIPEITLLRHRFDRTLGVSKILLKKKRLGRHGLSSDTPSVKTIDVTQKSTKGFKDRLTHHLYMYKSPKVVNMIGAFFE